MKRLNRKQYKQDIQEFRKTCPIAQIQNQWVKFYDEFNQSIFMFVHYSVIKRFNKDKDNINKSYVYKYKDYEFVVELCGNPSIRESHYLVDMQKKSEIPYGILENYGQYLSITRYGLFKIHVGQNNRHKLVYQTDVENFYNKMCDFFKERYKYIFKIN